MCFFRLLYMPHKTRSMYSRQRKRNKNLPYVIPHIGWFRNSKWIKCEEWTKYLFSRAHNVRSSMYHFIVAGKWRAVDRYRQPIRVRFARKDFRMTYNRIDYFPWHRYHSLPISFALCFSFFSCPVTRSAHSISSLRRVTDPVYAAVLWCFIFLASNFNIQSHMHNATITFTVHGDNLSCLVCFENHPSSQNEDETSTN